MCRTRKFAACVGSAILLSIACGNENTRKPRDPENARGTAEIAPADATPTVTVTITAVDIDTQLAVMCGVPTSKIFFEFDSAKVPRDAEQLLQHIATCVQSGPAKGEQVAIVGRAGPIGAYQYNEQLGLSRAEAVANHLRARGIPDHRLQIESRGEEEADESRPSTWPSERRVTIRLSTPKPNGGAQ